MKVHRAASSLQLKEDFGALIGRAKCGMKTKLHSVADPNGRPSCLFMAVRQVSDYTGAATLLDYPPKTQ